MFPNPNQLFSSFCLFTSTHGSLRNVLPPPERRAAVSGRYVLHMYSAESSLLASFLWTQGCVVKVAPLRGSSAYVGSGSTKVEPLCIHVCPQHQPKQWKSRAVPPQTEPISSESKSVLLLKNLWTHGFDIRSVGSINNRKFSYSELCFWKTHIVPNQMEVISWN